MSQTVVCSLLMIFEAMVGSQAVCPMVLNLSLVIKGFCWSLSDLEDRL